MDRWRGQGEIASSSDIKRTLITLYNEYSFNFIVITHMLGKFMLIMIPEICIVTDSN